MKMANLVKLLIIELLGIRGFALEQVCDCPKLDDLLLQFRAAIWIWRIAKLLYFILKTALFLETISE